MTPFQNFIKEFRNDVKIHHIQDIIDTFEEHLKSAYELGEKNGALKAIEEIPELPPHPYNGVAAIHYFKILKQTLKERYQ